MRLESGCSEARYYHRSGVRPIYMCLIVIRDLLHRVDSHRAPNRLKLPYVALSAVDGVGCRREQTPLRRDFLAQMCCRLPGGYFSKLRQVPL